MKKNITILAVCALIFALSFQAPSYAMEKENSIPIDILETEKKKCQTILPTLKTNLELWRTHYPQSSKLKTLPFRAHYFPEIRKSADNAQKVDELYVQIKEQSDSLLNILVDLEEKYQPEKDIIVLMGLENEWNAIGKNIAVFLSHYIPKDIIEQLTSGSNPHQSTAS